MLNLNAIQSPKKKVVCASAKKKSPVKFKFHKSVKIISTSPCNIYKLYNTFSFILM